MSTRDGRVKPQKENTGVACGSHEGIKKYTHPDKELILKCVVFYVQSSKKITDRFILGECKSKETAN